MTLVVGLLVGCSPQPQTLTAPAPSGPPPRPPKELTFYRGDTHFHSGFSGDNSSDGPPRQAFQAALGRVRPDPELGGYFLFLSDHIQYVNTRLDMDEQRYQEARRQADDKAFDVQGPKVTFTTFVGGEMTGLGRAGAAPWDDKFGHLNLFGLTTLQGYAENALGLNPRGQTVMDRFAQEPDVLGQFNHPGYDGEPCPGDSPSSNYPYSPARDAVFRWIEISNGDPANWEQGESQFYRCLDRGYHVAPAVGSDRHHCAQALEVAGTFLLAPPSLGVPLAQRRQLLWQAARASRGYASEDPDLRIEWSLDGHLMGECVTPPPARMRMQIRLRHTAGQKLGTVELRQGPSAPLRRWHIPAASWQWEEAIPTQSLRFLCLRIQTESGRRALTAPITFYSSASVGDAGVSSRASIAEERVALWHR